MTLDSNSPPWPAGGVGFKLEPQDVGQVGGRGVVQLDRGHCAVDGHLSVRGAKVKLVDGVLAGALLLQVHVDVVVLQQHPASLPDLLPLSVGTELLIYCLYIYIYFLKITDIGLILLRWVTCVYLYIYLYIYIYIKIYIYI